MHKKVHGEKHYSFSDKTLEQSRIIQHFDKWHSRRNGCFPNDCSSSLERIHDLLSPLLLTHRGGKQKVSIGWLRIDIWRKDRLNRGKKPSLLPVFSYPGCQ